MYISVRPEDAGGDQGIYHVTLDGFDANEEGHIAIATVTGT